MIVVFGADAAALCRYLQTNGLDAGAANAEQVASLTGLLMGKPEISDIVLLEGAEKNWSMGHILAAAKQLQSRGRLILMGSHKPLPALLCAVSDREALLALLKKPAKPGNTGTAGGHSVSQRDRHGFTEAPAVPKIRPLNIPPGKILFLGIVGSQHRIGCTTQSVGLWHYCKALGFDPAIVSDREQIAQIAAPMHSQEIPGGYRIEGIPFVTDTALAYDCYLLDIGVGDIREARQITDCLVLVAGAKPWELPHTAAALRTAGDAELVVLLSFCSRADGAALSPLFGRRAAAVLPWMPSLWQPSVAALSLYNTLLRPVLERTLAREEPLPEETPERQQMKGDMG